MANIKDAMSIEEECNEANQPIIYRYESPFFPATKSPPPTTPPSALIILNTPIKFSGDDNTNYNQGILSEAMLEIYRRSCKYDNEDPIDLADFEKVPNLKIKL